MLTDNLNAFYVIARGDSMRPDIIHGDRLLIEPNQEVVNGDIVLAQVDEGCTVKRFQRLDTETVLLKPDNRKYPTIIVRASEHPEFRCCPVTEIQRRTRRTPSMVFARCPENALISA